MDKQSSKLEKVNITTLELLKEIENMKPFQQSDIKI